MEWYCKPLSNWSAKNNYSCWNVINILSTTPAIPLSPARVVCCICVTSPWSNDELCNPLWKPLCFIALPEIGQVVRDKLPSTWRGWGLWSGLSNKLWSSGNKTGMGLAYNYNRQVIDGWSWRKKDRAPIMWSRVSKTDGRSCQLLLFWIPNILLYSLLIQSPKINDWAPFLWTTNRGLPDSCKLVLLLFSTREETSSASAFDCSASSVSCVWDIPALGHCCNGSW